MRDYAVVKFSEARNHFKQVIDQVIDDANYTLIARRDATDPVVMSLETFNSFIETAYVLHSIGQYDPSGTLD